MSEPRKRGRPRKPVPPPRMTEEEREQARRLIRHFIIGFCTFGKLICEQAIAERQTDNYQI